MTEEEKKYLRERQENNMLYFKNLVYAVMLPLNNELLSMHCEKILYHQTQLHLLISNIETEEQCR